MRVVLGILDFGKIKSAKVSLGGFSVFIGNNNSGKTYVMQLLYGVMKNLSKYLSDTDLCAKYLQRLQQQAETGIITIDASSFGWMEQFLNAVLQKYKEQVVLDTFYEPIEIGQMDVRLTLEEDEHYEFLVYDPDHPEKYRNALFEQLSDKNKQTIEKMIRDQGIFPAYNKPCVLFQVCVSQHKKELVRISFCDSKKEIPSVLVRLVTDYFAADGFSGQLFLPASRTGLLMLYKEFFAAKTDEAVRLSVNGSLSVNESLYPKSKKMGITQPVYDFLRFMQTFSLNRNTSFNSDFVRFIEEHLIEGRILIDQRNQPVYQAQGAKQELPLYLSSSMINELMPVLYVLQSVEQPKYLIWDEIETSLHPQKQMELARLLSRMSNAGFLMAVSTHSDTMAAKINNLCLLSFSQLLNGKRAEILKQTGLSEADLFQEKIHVYQFEHDNAGRSFVRELEYDEVTGYQFTLFHDSVEKLFQETRLILE
ncbi:MAG: ATP-binding protein [Eubacterium sp.]|nr:ATP-binding protein [Eubacterium sp.]